MQEMLIDVMRHLTFRNTLKADKIFKDEIITAVAS